MAVALSTELDRELVEEGTVRELVHKVRNLRREEGFEIEDTVSVELSGSPRLKDLLSGAWGDYFKGEVLAGEVQTTSKELDGDSHALEVDGERAWVKVSPLGGDGQAAKR